MPSFDSLAHITEPHYAIEYMISDLYYRIDNEVSQYGLITKATDISETDPYGFIVEIKIFNPVTNKSFASKFFTIHYTGYEIDTLISRAVYELVNKPKQLQGGIKR